ncbi:MAG: serine/threonine-protein kinase PknK [Acidobacteriota bacterium]
MAHINSRYRIIRVLGENPDSGVFLAEDTLFANTHVALKTIRSTGIDDRHLNQLREEFFTLSRFKHPNIAQVFDFGTIHSTDMPGYEGNFFFTLEYIEGKDLYHFTENADPECMAELLFQTAHALSYIHKHGLIHFDIKPSNIIVTNALWGDEAVPMVKIIDFGFAASTIASLDEPIRGSLNYIAPELLRGDEYDRRADLYSLGASLYEIIMRKPLFCGESATAIIKQHLSCPAPPTHRKRPDIPEHIHRLVAQLLEKDPARRPSSADEIVARLRGTFTRDALYHTVLVHIPLHALVGRDEETSRLQRFLADGLGSDADKNIHPAYFITGETGIGKTSLLHEVRRRSQAGGMIVFDTQCFARHSKPYEPMLKVLRDQTAYVRSFGAKGDALLARHQEFLSIAFPSAQGEQDSIARETDDPSKRVHFVDMWADCFFDIASVSPYAVLVDNIDNADESTLELLQYLIRNARTRRVRFLIAGISDAKTAPLLQAVPDAPAETLDLGALDEEAVEQLLAIHLNVGSAAAPLSHAITQKIGGAPSIVREFISQYATTAPEEVVPAIEADIAHLSGSFAQTIARLYEQKLSKRKPEELFLLRLMSCFDSPVPLKLLEAISPFTQRRLKNFLDLLVNLGIVRPIENASRYYLAQSQFQSYIYAQLGEEKAMLHALIAETMAKENAGAFQNPEAIANHYKHAGDPANAYTYFRRAAELKRAHYALYESIALLNEACMCMPPEENDLSLYEHLAQSYSQAGDYRNAVLLYEQLRSEASDDAKRYTYAKELGLIHNREGRLEEAVSCLSEASGLARTVEETIDVEEELTIIDMSRGRYAEAYERCTRVLTEHSDAMNSVAVTGIINNLGIIHFYQNHYDDAASCFSRSITILQNEGEKSKLIGPYLNLGNVHSAQGRFAEAARHWQHALLLAQEVGNLQQEARAYNNIGIAAFNQGNNEEAALHYEKAYGIFSRLGFVPGMALCLTNIGEVHMATVDYERAIECWEKDLQLYASLQDEHGMTEINLQLAGVRLIFGETEEARRLLADAEALLGANQITTQHALARYVKGCIDLACESFAEAREALKKAHALYHDAKDHRSGCLAMLKLAEVEDALGTADAASALLEEVRLLSIEHCYPLIEAEALFLLGGLAARQALQEQKPPILLYMRAFEVIQSQNVTEVTWQICHTLGQEYMKRGLHEKGALYLGYAKHSLEYIGGKISSPALRERYYTASRRGAILAEIDALISGKGKQ